MIQMVDFISFALLREHSHVQSRNHYGIHQAFSIVENLMIRKAFKKDRRGIIRG